jgi:hypothetical protein
MRTQNPSDRPEWRELFHNPSMQEQARDLFNQTSARALEDLQPVRFRGALAPGEVAVLCVLRNEAARLPLFFEHYRKLGVERFFMVDNDSSDGSGDILWAEPRADIFHTKASFERSYFGMYWYNGLARAYCRDHWIAMADADELLVFDGMESHDIKAFAAWLECQGTDRAFAPMIDLYTSGAIGSRRRSVSEIVAQDSWFDTKGYRIERYPAGWIFVGGPRERLFNTKDRNQPHWISKYPFFRMTDEKVLFDNHFLWPWDDKYRGPDAALLHLKILDDFVERCAVNEQENQHAHGSHAYRIINQQIAELPALIAVNANSRRYEGPASLVRHQLLLPIDWDAGPTTHGRRILNRIDKFRLEEPREWLETLPTSGLIWDRFDEYNQRSDHALNRHLKTVRCRGPLAPGEVGAICILRNEAKRLPLFFDHYKQLGVDRFFMVDNGSDDGSHDLLLAEPSADVFFAHASFVEGNYGLYWSNGLARRHCIGNWMIMADADELFVYDGMETKDLADLGAWLETHGQDRIFSVMVDVYPSGPIADEHRSISDILAEDCWFDSEGYSLEPNYGGWLITGGPRHRVFNPGRTVPYAHWLSKYPFFNMAKNRAIVSNHWLWPIDWRKREPHCALLHLKLMDDFIERSARYEREGQHAAGSESYRLINERLVAMPQVEFFHPNSRRYRGPKSLIRYRVMQTIDWNK